MIESSRKRFYPLEIGDNVRVPFPIVDRAPIGPSASGTVTDIYSDRDAFQIGTKHGTCSIVTIGIHIAQHRSVASL